MQFEELITALSKINEELCDQGIRAVNTSLTLRNWFFGFYIFEFEQHGKDRAEYGKALLANISVKLKALSVPNADERELRRFRQFYIAYPVVAALIETNSQIRGFLPPELRSGDNFFKTISFRGLENPELQVSENHFVFGHWFLFLVLMLLITNLYNLFVHWSDNQKEVQQVRLENDRIRNAWDYLYDREGKTGRRLMDSAYSRHAQ